MRMTLNRGTLATAVAEVALVLSACSSDSEEPTATTEPTTEPVAASDGSDDGASVTGLVGNDLSSPMGPRISVSDALGSDQIGPISMNGFMLIKDGEARLCEALSEEQGVQWTDDVVQIVGVRNGDVLEITEGLVG